MGCDVLLDCPTCGSGEAERWWAICIFLRVLFISMRLLGADESSDLNGSRMLFKEVFFSGRLQNLIFQCTDLSKRSGTTHGKSVEGFRF